jgi:hypothetical protein|tara:strand:- start:290 stop:745 length:456 start_codon:yes stop_codon:yes gene_type:complete
MNIKLIRYSDGGDSTLGLIFIDDYFNGYTLEDEARKVKVAGETRIPPGSYEIKFRAEPASKMNQRYQNKYAWFKWHLWLQDVPGFEWIYIHQGTNDEHTDGCILVGDATNNNVTRAGKLGGSPTAYKRIYLKISAALESGEKVFIKVIDED